MDQDCSQLPAGRDYVYEGHLPGHDLQYRPVPHRHATDRGTYLIQDEIVTGPEALAELREHGNGIPDHETVVEVPAALMTYVREHQETTS